MKIGNEKGKKDGGIMVTIK